MEAKIKTKRLGFSDFLPKSQRLETREGSAKVWSISRGRGRRFLPKSSQKLLLVGVFESRTEPKEVGSPEELGSQDKGSSPEDFLRKSLETRRKRKKMILERTSVREDDLGKEESDGLLREGGEFRDILGKEDR